MSPRLNTDSKGNLVGPGQYDLKGSIELNRHGYQFSRDKKDYLEKRNIPGPGSYEY